MIGEYQNLNRRAEGLDILYTIRARRPRGMGGGGVSGLSVGRFGEKPHAKSQNRKGGAGRARRLIGL